MSKAKPKSKTKKPKAPKVKTPKVEKPAKVKETKEMVVIEANAPMTAPAMKQADEVVAPEVKPKPAKAKKPKQGLTKEVWRFDPPIVEYKRRRVDDGWRAYRLWSKYDLDYDDNATEDEKMKSIAAGIKKTKATLIKDLEALDAKELVVKTTLKTDKHIYDPFVEVWIALETECKTLDKLVEVASLTMIDPDYSLTVEDIESKETEDEAE